MIIDSVKVICVYRNTKKILLDYTCKFFNLFIPRIGEIMVINADEQLIVFDIKHFFDVDGYVIYIHLKEKY
jgi:hypothetical protein